jgi:hypothetical protein
MAIAFVSRVTSPQNSGSANSIPTAGLTINAGNLVVVAGSHDPNSGFDFTGGVTDDGGNTWHQAGPTFTPFGAADFSIAMFYTYNSLARASDVITMALTGSLPFRAYAVEQFSGLGTGDPLADYKTGFGTTSSDGQTVSTASLTLPGGSTEGVVVAYGLAAGAWLSAGTGYDGVMFDHPDAGAGVNFFLTEHHIVSASEAAQATADQFPFEWALIAGLFVLATTTTDDVPSRQGARPPARRTTYPNITY